MIRIYMRFLLIKSINRQHREYFKQKLNLTDLINFNTVILINNLGLVAEQIHLTNCQSFDFDFTKRKNLLQMFF